MPYKKQKSYSADEVKERICALFYASVYPEFAINTKREIAIQLLTNEVEHDCAAAQKGAETRYGYFDGRMGPIIAGVRFGQFYGIDGDDPQVDVYLECEDRGGWLQMLGGIDENTGKPYLVAANGGYGKRKAARAQYEAFLQKQEMGRRTAAKDRKSSATMRA